eukprot:768681-Hanusia_phi.AAC.6
MLEFPIGSQALDPTTGSGLLVDFESLIDYDSYGLHPTQDGGKPLIVGSSTMEEPKQIDTKERRNARRGDIQNWKRGWS